MKKAIFLVLGACMLMTCLLGCQPNDFVSSADSSDNISDVKSTPLNSNIQAELSEHKEKEDMVLSKASQLSMEQLITKRYSEKEFYEKGVLYRSYQPLVSFHFYLYSISDLFPVECIRQTSDDSIYCIYKTKENGLIYLFFVKRWNEWYMNHAIYSKKSLTLSDFQNIKIGDNRKAIEQIDPIVSTDSQYSQYQFTLHLLKDGVVKIEYELKDGQMLVSNIQRKSDFKLTMDDITYDYSILPQDYIH